MNYVQYRKEGTIRVVGGGCNLDAAKDIAVRHARRTLEWKHTNEGWLCAVSNLRIYTICGEYNKPCED